MARRQDQTREQRRDRKEAKRKRGMRVVGASVKTIQRIIQEQAENLRKSLTSELRFAILSKGN